MKRRTWGLALLSLATMVVAGSVLAADWKPTKPITVIVPWPEGGSTDLTVRILASASRWSIRPVRAAPSG